MRQTFFSESTFFTVSSETDGDLKTLMYNLFKFKFKRVVFESLKTDLQKYKKI